VKESLTPRRANSDADLFKEFSSVRETSSSFANYQVGMGKVEVLRHANGRVSVVVRKWRRETELSLTRQVRYMRQTLYTGRGGAN